MSLKGLIVSALALLIIIVVAITFNSRGPDPSTYLHLKDPAIRTMPAQRVLVVEAKGAPGATAKKAFGLLFKAYYSIKGAPKASSAMVLRARWPVSASVPQAEWVGKYAMAIPDSILEARLPTAPEGMIVKIDKWEYGEVAEILHVGPYTKETPTIERLLTFIEENGYEVVGDHEEEYLKGPGMVLRGKPEKYVTIIRYRIKKREIKGDTLVAVV